MTGQKYHKLPELYTQTKLPVTKQHKPKQDSINKWKYLREVKIPQLDADIELLKQLPAGTAAGSLPEKKTGKKCTVLQRIHSLLGECHWKGLCWDGAIWCRMWKGVVYSTSRSAPSKKGHFDSSLSFQGISLNSTLIQGPNLTSNLVGVLLRFRQEPVALMADIESMFHQVRVAERHVNFLRFLWWPSGDTSQPLREYRMTYSGQHPHQAVRVLPLHKLQRTSNISSPEKQWKQLRAISMSMIV